MYCSLHFIRSELQHRLMTINIIYQRQVTDLQVREDFLKQSLLECSQALEDSIKLLIIQRGNNIPADLFTTAAKCQELIRLFSNP